MAKQDDASTSLQCLIAWFSVSENKKSCRRQEVSVFGKDQRNSGVLKPETRNLAAEWVAGSARVREWKGNDSRYSVFHHYSRFNIRYPIPPGFTLLELLVVLVIIAAISSLVGPRLLGSMSSTNLRIASKKVATSLRYARTQAVSEGVIYVAAFDVETRKITIKARRPGTGGEGEAPADEEKGPGGKELVYDLPEGITIEKAVSGDKEVRSSALDVLFFPNGGSSGARIVLINERDNRCVVVVDFITGAVQVEKHAA
jgi:general secretion pathway protein H